jgi:hypothetical protein
MGQEAGGKETTVVVVCADDDWEQAGPNLSEAFSVKEKTLPEQLVFDLVRYRAQDLELYRFRKNLILLGDMDSEVFRDVLSEDARVMVRSGESYMFGSLDGWIGGQILVMIVAPPEEPLSRIVELAGPAAFEYFRTHSLDRIRKRIYGDGIEEKTKDHTKKAYGWTLDLPRGYRIADEDSSGRFVSFIKHDPERVILVYWGFEKGEKSWVDVRNEMSSVYLQGDEVVLERASMSDVNFRGYRARKIEGHWENEDKVMGGPFTTYCFQDTISGTYYMVDYNVFAPAMRKWPILGQVEWITQTFTLDR